MAADLIRFTISVPQKIELALDSLKQRHYNRDTQNDMIQDLIMKGLEGLKGESDLNE